MNINVSSKAKVTLVCSIQLPEGLRPRFCNEHIASSSASGLCGSVEPGIECERLSCESCWSSVETFMTPGPPGSRNREVLAKGFGKSLMRHTGYPCRAWPHLQSPEALLRIHPKNLANHMNDWSIRRWDGDRYTNYFPQKATFSSSVGLETQFSSHHSQLLSELRMASVLSAMGSCTSSLRQAWYTVYGTNMNTCDPVSMNPVLIESPIIHETQQSGSPGIPFCIPILSVETHSWSTKLANWAWLRVLGEKLNKWITRVQLDDLCLVKNNFYLLPIDLNFGHNFLFFFTIRKKVKKTWHVGDVSGNIEDWTGVAWVARLRQCAALNKLSEQLRYKYSIFVRIAPRCVQALSY